MSLVNDVIIGNVKDTHSVQPVVQEHDFDSPSLSCPHQHIPGVRVAVDEPLEENHLTVHLTQLERNLYVCMCVSPCVQNVLSIH